MKKVFLASLALTVFAISITLFQMSSCTKAIANIKTDTIYKCNATIKGLWVGQYNVSSKPYQGNLFYSLTIYPDSTVVARGLGNDGNYYYSSGKWSYKNNTFSATIVSFVTPGSNPVTQSINMTIDNNGNFVSGTWADVINPNGSPLNGQLINFQKVN